MAGSRSRWEIRKSSRYEGRQLGVVPAGSCEYARAGEVGIGAIFSLINLHFAHAELEKSNRFNAGENNIKWKNAIGGAASGVATYGAAACEARAHSGVFHRA